MTDATTRTLATARPPQMVQKAAQKAAEREAALLKAYLDGEEGTEFYQKGIHAVKTKNVLGPDYKVRVQAIIPPCPYKGMPALAWKQAILDLGWDFEGDKTGLILD